MNENTFSDDRVWNIQPIPGSKMFRFILKDMHARSSNQVSQICHLGWLEESLTCFSKRNSAINDFEQHIFHLGHSSVVTLSSEVAFRNFRIIILLHHPQRNQHYIAQSKDISRLSSVTQTENQLTFVTRLYNLKLLKGHSRRRLMLNHPLIIVHTLWL